MLVSLAVKEQEGWAGKRGWEVLVGCRGLEALEGSRTQLSSWWATFCARLGNFWGGPTSCPSAKESPDTPFFFCSGSSQPSNFWEGSLRSLRWALLFKADRQKAAAPAGRGVQQEICLQQLVGGVLLAPLRSPPRPEIFAPAERWLCAYMSCRSWGLPVNLNLSSYRLSRLAQVEGKT